MRCVITGHTIGIGKSIAEYFKNKGWEVIGLSRSNGYDVFSRYNDMLEIAKTADLFVNNMSRDGCQIKFLNDLAGVVNKIICCGSIAADYDHVLNYQYSKEKLELKKLCKKLSLTHQDKTKILHLNISLTEDSRETDCGLPHSDIVKAIDFWMDNPRINNIEFELKLNDFTIKNITKDFGSDPRDSLL